MLLIKNKYFLICISFVLLILVVSPQVVLSGSEIVSNQSKITQIVIQDILSLVPQSIKRICVLEISFNGKSQSTKPLDLKHLDNRIVTDNSTCVSRDHSDPSKTVIIYMNDVKSAIGHIKRPPGKRGEAYDRIQKFVNTDNFLSIAGIDECGADIHIFVFTIGPDGLQLIESAVIGSVECLSK